MVDTLEALRVKLEAYQAALNGRDDLLRKEHEDNRDLRASHQKWARALAERDNLLTAAYAEIKEKDGTIRTLQAEVEGIRERVDSAASPDEAPKSSTEEEPDKDDGASIDPPDPPRRSVDDWRGRQDFEEGQEGGA